MISYHVYKMAIRTGLEPATSSVTGWHSNQLNYRTLLYFDVYFKFKLVAGARFELATFGL